MYKKVNSFDSRIVENTNISLTMPFGVLVIGKLGIKNCLYSFFIKTLEYFIIINIVGLIAFLSLSSIFHNYKKEKYFSRLKTVYSQLKYTIEQIALKEENETITIKNQVALKVTKMLKEFFITSPQSIYLIFNKKEKYELDWSKQIGVN